MKNKKIIMILITLISTCSAIFCFLSKNEILSMLSLFIFATICFPSYIISIYIAIKASAKAGTKMGEIKARLEFDEEINKIKLSNPYLYFREIPDTYGIGVSAFLLNYEIGKEDIIAAILDLCAKGYIKFKQINNDYEIISNNIPTNNLLSNELYVLDWIQNGNNKKFNIEEWKELCREDSIKLGLVSIKDSSNKIKLINFNDPFMQKLIIILTMISVSLVIITFNIMILFMDLTIFNFLILILLIDCAWEIPLIIIMLVAIYRKNKSANYNESLKKAPLLTELGKQEYHELYSLGKFLNDFSDIANKHIEEIVIWEQYLPYSLLFRISNKILKSEYSRLKVNECFIIDNIENLKII